MVVGRVAHALFWGGRAGVGVGGETVGPEAEAEQEEGGGAGAAAM